MQRKLMLHSMHSKANTLLHLMVAAQMNPSNFSARWCSRETAGREAWPVDATAPQHPQARTGILSIRAEPVKTIVEQRLSLKSEYNPRGGHGSNRSRQIGWWWLLLKREQLSFSTATRRRHDAWRFLRLGSREQFGPCPTPSGGEWARHE